jgi:hypothetical protein
MDVCATLLSAKAINKKKLNNFFIMACIDILNIILSTNKEAQNAAILLTI